METQRYAVELIHVPARIRSRIDQERVSALADSMASLGLMTPISIYVDQGNRFNLIAGHHRLLAAKQLGWQGIDCIISKAGETERRLWEIAENLHRAELTVQERAAHVAEWVRLVAKPGQVAHVSGGRGNQGGISSASRHLGIERTDVRRAIKIDSITPDAKDAAKDAKLDDNQSALLKVAAAPKSRQVEVVQRIAEEKAEPKPTAALRRELTPEEKAQREMQDRLANVVIGLIRNWHVDNRNAPVELICDALRDVVIRLQDGEVEIGQ
jgi:ParB-like chromosome segregation protein Spo0J